MPGRALRRAREAGGGAVFAAASVAAVVLAGAVLGCGGDRDAAPKEAPMESGGFTLVSSAFTTGQTIPTPHTCDGEDVSPPLAWSGVPAAAASFALLCDDPDAPRGTWVHWVLYDLDPSVTSLPRALPRAATVAGGARQGQNDFGKLGYGGPCPPRGPAHRYFFRLLALDRKLGLDSGATMREVLAAAEGHILARAELMGRYGR